MASINKFKESGNHVTHLRQDRKFYPAPNIAEQALPVTQEVPISSECIHYPKSRVYGAGRPLGIFEQMYFRQSLKGADIISLMIRVESMYPITEEAVRHAIRSIMERHPLMRMTVTNKHGSYVMEESDSESYDLKCSPRTDWMRYIKEEFDQPFGEQEGLLWRIRLLNSSRIPRQNQEQYRNFQQIPKTQAMCFRHSSRQSNILVQSISDESSSSFDDDVESELNYQTTFLFIYNHAIADGGYTMWIFQEFVTFLDAYNTGINISRIKQLPLLPPLEQCLSLNSDEVCLPDATDFSVTQSYLQYCDGPADPTMLDKYTIKYRHEIQSLSGTIPKNNFVIFKFDKHSTRTFVNACKSRKVKANTAIVTASLLALIDLLYDTTNSQTEFVIPFEYMSDSRRRGILDYTGSHEFLFPGLAALNIPLRAHIQIRRPVTVASFWEISKSFDHAIRHEIHTTETIQSYCEEYNRLVTSERDLEVKGKCPYVLCFSNMGKLDDLFNDDVSKRFRMVDLHGQSNVLRDDMPIFFVNTFALNGHLVGGINYCEGFTSEHTTRVYLALIQKYLTMYSKF